VTFAPLKGPARPICGTQFRRQGDQSFQLRPPQQLKARRVSVRPPAAIDQYACRRDDRARGAAASNRFRMGQLIRQQVAFLDTDDGLGPVAPGATSDTSGRLGLRSKWTTTIPPAGWQPRVLANAWRDCGTAATTMFGPVPLLPQARPLGSALACPRLLTAASGARKRPARVASCSVRQSAMNSRSRQAVKCPDFGAYVRTSTQSLSRTSPAKAGAPVMRARSSIF